MKRLKLLSILDALRERTGPRNVSVVTGDTFLFASFEHGEEQIVDVRAFDDSTLASFWAELVSSADTDEHGASRRPRTDTVPVRV